MSAIVEYAIRKYFNEYTDEYGRACLYKRDKAKRDNFDNENPHLFTGEAMLLLRMHGRLDCTYEKQQWATTTISQVQPGLFGRQRVGQNFGNTVSRDEYNGLCYQAAACESAQYFRLVNDIIAYGEQNKNTYDDGKPNSGFNFRYWRQPKDTCFYKIISDTHKPSTFEKVYLALANILSAILNKKSVSGRLMAFYRMSAIRLVNHDSVIINSSYSFFNWYSKRKYGEDYLAKWHTTYFKDLNHPFHILVKHLPERHR